MPQTQENVKIPFLSPQRLKIILLIHLDGNIVYAETLIAAFSSQTFLPKDFSPTETAPKISQPVSFFNCMQ